MSLGEVSGSFESSGQRHLELFRKISCDDDAEDDDDVIRAKASYTRAC